MNYFKRLLKIFKLTVLGILLALLIYPITLAIFISILIYRSLLIFFVKKWDLKVCQIISGMSALMVGCNPYNKPEFVLMVGFPLKSQVNRRRVIDVINKQILISNEFPELSQRIVKIFGYCFWYKTDKKISAADHVHYLNPKCQNEPVSRSQLLELEGQKIARQPMPEDRSPWEIILVPNLIDDLDPSNKSLAILRTHHCLMDGYTIINFMKKSAVQPWREEKLPQAQSQKTSKWKSLQQFLVILATGPYHLINQAIFNNDNSNFMKLMFLDQQKKQDRQFLKGKENCRISMKRLKNIKSLHNANMSSIIITLVMGATTRFIKKRCGKVERNMFLQMAYPVPGHPGKPTNHWTNIRMPIHFQENDPVKTLKRNTAEFEKTRNSVIPTINFYVAKLLGQLPVFLIPKTEDLGRQVIYLSNMPGPSGKEDIFGYMYDDMTMQAVIRNGTAFLFGCLSVGEKLGIHFGANSYLFKTDEDASDMNKYLESIINTLEQ